MQRFYKQVPLLIGFVVILSAGAFATNYSKTLAENKIRQELFYTVELAVAATDPNLINQLSVSADDTVNPGYLRLREQYLKLQSPLEKKQIRWIYAMKIFDNQEVRFLLDSVPVDDSGHSEPGVVYEEPPSAVFQAATAGTALFTGPFTDEYGSYYSVFAPIRDFTKGSVIGVMGADVEVTQYQALIKQQLKLPITITGLGTSLFLIVYLIAMNRRAARLTEQEHQLERLEYAKEREALLFNIGEGVVACNASGKVIFVNRFAAAVVGQTPADCLGVNFRNHWLMLNAKGESLAESAQPIFAILKDSDYTPPLRPMFLKRADGTLMPVSISMSHFVSDHGKRAIVIMVFRDVSREAELDRMKSEFISMAAHQLKSPITVLNWSTEMLTKYAKNNTMNDARAEITAIRRTVVNMTDLVNSLLNVSRLESGRISIEPKPTRLGTLASEVIADLDITAVKKKQKLTLSRATRLPQIKTDQRLIKEVLKNLLTNAIKYTPTGGKVRVRVETVGKEVITSVTDSGVGIPDQEQKKIFQKFFRASNTTSMAEGTGLGLYLAQKIVEACGGRIWFTSQQGQGTTFSFALPLSGSKQKPGEVTIT